jgi:hypothetical protein
MNCGAPVNPDNNRCAYCKTAQSLMERQLLGQILKNKSFRMTALYPMLLGAGITMVVYIYMFAFDDFSETAMVRITPIWFFFIIFGLYGYFAEYMMNKVIVGEGENISDAYNRWLSRFLRRHIFPGFILMIILLPFSFIKFRNSLLIAFTGSFIWGILLFIFFAAIFPAL